jgi:hypothetical protein
LAFAKRGLCGRHFKPIQLRWQEEISVWAIFFDEKNGSTRMGTDYLETESESQNRPAIVKALTNRHFSCRVSLLRHPRQAVSVRGCTVRDAAARA